MEDNRDYTSTNVAHPPVLLSDTVPNFHATLRPYDILDSPAISKAYGISL